MYQYDVRFTFSDNRPLSGEIGSTWGDYYGGNWYSFYVSSWWVPFSLIACGLDYSYNNFDMPDGHLDSHLASLWLTFRFTPTLRWANLIQYDTISDEIGFNSRFSWEYREGRRLDLVLKQLYLNDSGFHRLDSELIAKVGMQIRF
jgi:hypothetical protein